MASKIINLENEQKEALSVLKKIIENFELLKNINRSRNQNQTIQADTQDDSSSKRNKETTIQKDIPVQTYEMYLSKLKKIFKKTKKSQIDLKKVFDFAKKIEKTLEKNDFNIDFDDEICADLELNQIDLMDQNGQSNSSNVEDSSCSEETEIDLLEQRYAQLNESFKNFEDLDVREKPEYQPKNPCETPDFFPKECYHRRTLKEFRKLDIETFFFIFYFQQGTIEQNFAAKILKGNSWRFHKHFLTWFQRSKEPDVTVGGMERGSYIYFDYESSWCYRNKENFVFDYKFLENELPY